VVPTVKNSTKLDQTVKIWDELPEGDPVHIFILFYFILIYDALPRSLNGDIYTLLGFDEFNMEK